MKLKVVNLDRGRSYQALTGLLSRWRIVCFMALEHDYAAAVAYRGEIWTDGRGLAVVVLPAEAWSLKPPLDYTLESAEPHVAATVASELEHGRFTIKTDEPHVKVSWHVVSLRRKPGRGD